MCKPGELGCFQVVACGVWVVSVGFEGMLASAPIVPGVLCHDLGCVQRCHSWDLAVLGPCRPTQS